MAISDARHGRLRQLIQPGLDALRRLWLPFVLVQLTGLAIVLMYFHVPAVTAICDRAGVLKAQLGFPFSMIAMAIASGIVPEVFKTMTGVDRTFDRRRGTALLHNLVIFSISGLTVDLFYTGVGNWLGDSRRVPIVAVKVFFDQFGYTPLWAMPLVGGSYALRRCGYRLGEFVRTLDRGWYGREVMPVLLVCWAYWIPMVTLAYLLPPKLTFVYGLIASAAASTLLVSIADRARPELKAASVP